MEIYTKKPVYHHHTGEFLGYEYLSDDIHRCDMTGVLLEKAQPTVQFGYANVDPCWGTPDTCLELQNEYGIELSYFFEEPFMFDYEEFYGGAVKQAFVESPHDRFDFFLREVKVATVLYLLREGIIEAAVLAGGPEED